MDRSWRSGCWRLRGVSFRTTAWHSCLALEKKSPPFRASSAPASARFTLPRSSRSSSRILTGSPARFSAPRSAPTSAVTSMAALQQLAHHLRADEAVGARDGAAADLRSHVPDHPICVLPLRAAGAGPRAAATLPELARDSDVGPRTLDEPRRLRRAARARRRSSARRRPRCARAPSRSRRAARAGSSGPGAARSPAACASQPQKAAASRRSRSSRQPTAPCSFASFSPRASRSSRWCR